MKGFYMTQAINPCPNCNTYHCGPCTAPQANNYSGVKIDIHNPMVNIPQACTHSIYDMPEKSIYAPQETPQTIEETTK